MKKDEELLALVKLRKMSSDEVEEDRQGALEAVGLDPATELKSLEVVALIDAAFNLLIVKMEETELDLPYRPKDFASRYGRDNITLEEYFSELEKMGLPRVSIRMNSIRCSYLKSITHSHGKCTSDSHFKCITTLQC